jgi:hypothetical protein
MCHGKIGCFHSQFLPPKSGAYLSKALYDTPLNGKVLTLPANIRIEVLAIENGKHSSFQRFRNNYDRKKIQLKVYSS